MSTITHHIPVTTGQAHHMTLRLVQSYGAPAALSDYTVCGSILQDEETVPISTTGADASGILLTIPPLYPGSHSYNLHLKHKTSGTDYLFLQGNCDVSELIGADTLDNTAVEQITVALKDDLSGVIVTVQIDSETTAAAWEEIEAVARKTEGLQETISNLIPEARIEIAQATGIAKNDIATATATSLEAITQGATSAAETAVTTVTVESANIVQASKQDLDNYTLAEKQVLVSASNKGTQDIATAVTTGTGTINNAVATGKTSIDNYVAATQADFVRKSQANTWSGIQTFNANTLFNGQSITRTSVRANANELVTQAMAQMNAYVANANTWGYLQPANITDSGYTLSAFTGGTVRASAVGTGAVINTRGNTYVQDYPQRFYLYRIEYANNTCIHFGTSSINPSGIYQPHRPYMLDGNSSNKWTIAYFSIMGIGFNGNLFPVLLMYDIRTNELYYAEILLRTKGYKAFWVQTNSHTLYGEQKDVIYSGWVADTNRRKYRTEITTVGNGKANRVGGAVVYANSQGLNKDVTFRSYLAADTNKDLADYIDSLMDGILAGRPKTDFRILEADGSTAQPERQISPDGETVTYLVTAVKLWPEEVNGAYMCSLDPWITCSKGTNYINGTNTPVTITVSPNTTGAERQTWILAGLPDAPATIIKITQSAQS